MNTCMRLTLLASLSALGACGGGSGNHASKPTTIARVGGDQQTGIVGVALTTPLTVKVTDAGGQGVGGVAVAWAAASGGGKVWKASSVTDSSGQASAIATLGLTAGPNTFTATAQGLTGSPVTFTATGPAFSPAFAVVHLGTADPLQEGFAVWMYLLGQSTVDAVPEDMGRDVWRISGQTQSQQYAYYAAPLTPAQQTAFETDGFGLTVIARVEQGLAPAYTSASPAMIGVVAVSTTTKRFDVDLSIDAAGDTVVVLPDSVAYTGNELFVAPGRSLTLTGSGSSYHTYQLVYDPVTQLADLYVDGVVRLQDYPGLTTYSPDEGGSRPASSLLPAGVNGGEVCFHLVQLTSPAPSPVIP